MSSISKNFHLPTQTIPTFKDDRDDESESDDEECMSGESNGDDDDSQYSHRTSELLSEVRSFVSQFDEDNVDVTEAHAEPDGPGGIAVAPGRGMEPDGFRDFPDSRPNMNGSESTVQHHNLSHIGVPFGQGIGSGNYNGSRNNEVGVSNSALPPIVHSKMFKKFAVGVVSVCVVVVVLTRSSSSTNTTNNHGRESSRDSDQLIQDELPHFDIHLPPKPYETLDSPTSILPNFSPVSGETGDESTSTLHSGAVSASDTPSTELESVQPIVPPENHDDAVQQVVSKYKPTWYDRSSWKGKTYVEALNFCAFKKSRIPCPYEALCPLGLRSRPTGGYRDGDGPEAWAPIMDSPNEWVRVSSKDSCVKYSSVHSSLPSWGILGGDSEDITQNIACCTDPYDKDIENNESKRKEISALTKAEQTSLSHLHPIWFGREHGYSGTTYMHAVEFCRNVGNLSLCPIEAYCPDGPQIDEPLFLKTDVIEGEQWAPVSDEKGRWVFVGTKTDDQSASTCMTYEEINDQPPAWENDATKADIKKHIMCCTHGGQAKENSLEAKVEPIWVNEVHGWNGGSYDDAVSLCASFEKKLCPLTVYCPRGPNQPVMGRRDTDFNSEGEQWAPIYSAEKKGNEWVMIGQKYGNSLTTCMTHEELEGGFPAWGLSSDRLHAKKHIMCCSF